MPVFSSKIKHEFPLVRSFSFQSSASNSTVNSSFITVKENDTGGGPRNAEVLNVSAAFKYDGGLSRNPMSKISLGFDGSSTMHAAVIIDHKLEPGQFIEITGYVIPSRYPGTTTYQASNPGDKLELCYEFEDNINESATYHFLNTPASGVYSFGSSYSGQTVTEADFRGQGQVPTFSAGNVGTRGWQISDGESSKRFSEALQSDAIIPDITRDGHLDQYALHGAEDLVFEIRDYAKIVVFNDRSDSKSIYLKLTSRTLGGSGYITLHDFKASVYSVPGSYNGVGINRVSNSNDVLKIMPEGLTVVNKIDNVSYIPEVLAPGSAALHAVPKSHMVNRNTFAGYFCLNFGNETSIPGGRSLSSGPSDLYLIPLTGRRPAIKDPTVIEIDYFFIAPYDGVVESIAINASTHNGTKPFANYYVNGINVYKSTTASWPSVNDGSPINGLTNICSIVGNPAAEVFTSSDWAGTGAFSSGDWLVLTVQTFAQNYKLVGSIMLKFDYQSTFL